MTDDRSDTIETAILERVHAREPGATICPSEVARGLWAANEWRSRMDDVRAAAARLAEAGDVVATQHGATVDIRTARGPIRIGRPADNAS
ncbi:hypothetical protein SSPSH_002941 [Salinisphaera shabanensis E1L3A]|uniref:DUF3253 domain-containing protein n=1 Tax=Salinisphaera shabanensis E1L3A TaxID=1033802 RepID=U2FPT8_9GAMM|nr:DUF3253 domain-containing protein [Salinisphaera shabanensis]ERJ18164.1 hypothetical protein SSPSH_002941 [Salinisphaera shabanensis E1L3A]